MGTFRWPEEREYRILELDALARRCEVCGGSLQVTQWRPRKLDTFDGFFVVIMRDKRCADKACAGRATIHRHPAGLSLALPKDSLGLDVLLRIGELRHRDNMSFAAIARHLNEAGIPVKQRKVSDAYQRLLAALRGIGGESPEVLARLKKDGIVLLVDGVQFDACSPVLYIAVDANSGTVLFAERHDGRSAAALTALLERVKALGVPVRGIVSDKETGLVPAIQAVFPEVPHQYCQLHFIKRCAEPLQEPLGELNAEIKLIGERVRNVRREIASRPEPRTEEEQADREIALAMLDAAHAATMASGRAPFNPTPLKRHDRVEEVFQTGLEIEANLSQKKRGGTR